MIDEQTDRHSDTYADRETVRADRHMKQKKNKPKNPVQKTNKTDMVNDIVLGSVTDSSSCTPPREGDGALGTVRFTLAIHAIGCCTVCNISTELRKVHVN